MTVLRFEEEYETLCHRHAGIVNTLPQPRKVLCLAGRKQRVAGK